MLHGTVTEIIYNSHSRSPAVSPYWTCLTFNTLLSYIRC